MNPVARVGIGWASHCGNRACRALLESARCDSARDRWCGAWGVWGFVTAATGLHAGFSPAELSFPWSMLGGAFLVGLDPLSAFFLLPVFAMERRFGRVRPKLSYARPLSAAGLNLLIGSMVLVLLARHVGSLPDGVR